jgi:hypothetical protein
MGLRREVKTKTIPESNGRVSDSVGNTFSLADNDIKNAFL